MLSSCRSLLRPQRVASIVAASFQRNLLLTSVCARSRRDYKFPRPQTPQNNLLHYVILKSRSIDELERIVSLSLHVMKPEGLVDCLIRFKNILKIQELDLSSAGSTLLQTLSRKIIDELDSFSLDQVAQVMRVAGILKLECSNPLVQECCRTLAPRLRELDIDSLNTLLHAGHRFRGSSTLTESVLVSLPTVFESQLEKWDLSDARTSLRALDFAVRANLKVDKRDLVIDAARKFLHDAPLEHAVSTILNVANEGPCHVGPEDHKMHALLKDCLTMVARNISKLRGAEVDRIMTAYSKINIFERELHDALWSVAASWSHDEIRRLVDLSRAKDAFSSKDAETLAVLFQTHEEKEVGARDGAATRSPLIDDRDSFLTRTIFHCSTREQLQGVLEQNSHVMKPKLLVSSMVHYKNLARAEKGELVVADDPCFETLSNAVASKSSFFSSEQCVILLRLARKLELGQTHALIEALLRELSPRIQNMDLDQIMSLQDAVKRTKGESRLKDECMLTAWLAFESQVKEKLDRSNEQQCLSALDFILQNAMSSDVQDFVIDAAQEFLARTSPETAAQMIYALGFNKGNASPVESSKLRNVLETCFKVLAANLSNLDQNTVRRIMSAYARIDVLSNELNDAVWNLSATRSLDEIIISFSHISRSKTRLRDVELMKELLAVTKDKVGDSSAHECAKAMALLALHSPGVHSELGEIGLLLATNLARPDSDYRTSELFWFVRNLAVLGIFPEQELDYLFSEEYQRKFIAWKPGLVSAFIDLANLLNLQFGESCRYSAFPELMQRAAASHRKVELSKDLVDSMRNGLGGDQFFSQNVISPLGTEADLVVAINRNENPIELSDKQWPLKDLPEDTRVVGILQCFREHLYDDLETRKLPFLLREHFLRSQNICPVVINMVEWESLPSTTKVSHLMGKVEDAMRVAHAYKQLRVETSL